MRIIYTQFNLDEVPLTLPAQDKQALGLACSFPSSAVDGWVQEPRSKAEAPRALSKF